MRQICFGNADAMIFNRQHCMIVFDAEPDNDLARQFAVFEGILDEIIEQLPE